MFVTIFNRVVVLVVALLILVGAVITSLVAAGASTPDILPFFEAQLQSVADVTGGTAVSIIVISILVALAMLAILIMEFNFLREPRPLLVSSTEEGIVTIDLNSICVLAEKTASLVHNVQHVKCYTKETSGGLLISCRPLVLLGTNVVEVGAELQSSIKESIEELTGLSVANVDIKIKYQPVEARRLAVR
jgi:hypothetical protein